jgi:hypothetical protein
MSEKNSAAQCPVCKKVFSTAEYVEHTDSHFPKKKNEVSLRELHQRNNNI